MKYKTRLCSIQRLSTCACFALLTVALMGCNHVRTPVAAWSEDGHYLPAPHSTGLVEAGITEGSTAWIPDAPQPIGFIPVPSKCEALADPQGVRSITHRYQGRAKFDDAHRYYLDRMPLHGWTLVNSSDTEHVSIWHKGAEEMIVETKDLLNVSTIDVRIAPRLR